ncbi:MAG: M48 family metalloprotease [Planctomycetota bacterium]
MTRETRRRGRFTLLAAAIVLATGTCKSDPVTGSLYYSPLGSDFKSQDEYVRKNFLTELMISNDGGLLNEPEIVAACGKVFEQVTRAVPKKHRRGFEYSFYLSGSAQINAYTYGGGRVHCHLGLLARCNDAAEFAGLMAHEIGHNSHDHPGRGMGKGVLGRTLGRLGSVAGDSSRRLFEGIGNAMTAPVTVQFTRDQERQADDRAVDYTLAAGFDPDGTARFFEGMQRDFGGSGLQLFQTHPFPKNRVKRIRGRIADAQKKTPTSNLVKKTPEFERALARVREIMPYYEKLEAAFYEKDPEPLRVAATEGATALPQHPQFHFWLAMSHIGEEKNDLALASARRAAALDSTNFMVSYLHAVLALNEKQFAEAETAASRMLTIVPVLVPGYMLRGIARLGQRRREDAWADFDSAMELTPKKHRGGLQKEFQKYDPEYKHNR